MIVRLLHGGGLSHTTYRFNKVDITYTYDPAKPAATSVAAVIDPKSVDTAYEKYATDKDFNAEVYGDGFLNAVKFPAITFKSTGIAYTGNSGKMTGDLTMLGVTKPVTLDVTYNGSATQGGAAKMGFSARGVIKRSDFGVSRLIGPVSDEVEIILETEMVKKP